MRDQATRMREIAGLHGSSARSPKPFVFTVSSGKGGVGKSTVALNTALAFGDLGLRVILFDADANLAGLDIMSGVTPRFRLGNVLRADCDVEDALVSLGPGVRLLAGSSGEVDYPLLSHDAQQELLSGLLGMDERVDIVMIDTAAGLTPEIVQYAEAADAVMVVTGPEPTAVMDAYALIKVLTLGGSTQPVGVVVNNVPAVRAGEETFTKLRAAVHHFLRKEIHCAGVVPHDEKVSLAIQCQEPLIRRYPRSPAALSLQALACTMAKNDLYRSTTFAVAL